jgi:hypothetical protein
MPYLSLSCRICFPGEAKVQLESGETKSMNDLCINDMVLTVKNNELCYDRVYSFLHREVNRIGQYLQIHHDSNSFITMSAEHLIHRENDIVPARLVVPGDKIYMVSQDGMKLVTVTRIVETESQGVYSPLTFSGSIVVDNVLASCYAEYKKANSHKHAHAAMKPLRWKANMSKSTSKQLAPPEGLNPYCIMLGKLVYPAYKLVV